jgi:uncharacterized protein YbjT (DUF2867 family)
MKVLVIGATGGTGQHLVSKLLARGDEVTAFVRNPAAMTQKNERLKIAQGEARDAGSLERAVAGQDAVLSAFGPRSLKKDDIQEVFMGHLLAAMKKHGVKRLVNLSAWGAGDSASQRNLFLKILVSLVFKNVFADKERGEALLVSSDLDYINVRPAQLLNAPARGGVKASLDAKGIKPKIAREDLADFMIAQLSNATWVRKSPIVGY